MTTKASPTTIEIMFALFFIGLIFARAVPACGPAPNLSLVSLTVPVARTKAQNASRILRLVKELKPFTRGQISHDLAIAGLSFYEADLCTEALKAFSSAYIASRPLISRPVETASDAFVSGDISSALGSFHSILLQDVAADRRNISIPGGSSVPDWLDQTAEASELATRRHYLEAISLLNRIDGRRNTFLPFITGVIECANGDALKARASFIKSIEIGVSNSVHGGWFGLDDESLEAMRMVTLGQSMCRDKVTSPGLTGR